MGCFSAKHSALRRKSKDWLDRNQNNVSELSDIPTRGLLFQWASTIQIQLNMLVYYKADLITISLKINLFSPWYIWKIAELAINTNNSLTHTLESANLPARHLLCFVAIQKELTNCCRYGRIIISTYFSSRYPVLQIPSS